MLVKFFEIETFRVGQKFARHISFPQQVFVVGDYQQSIPIVSMYGIFTYNYYFNHPNVGKYAMNPMGLFPPHLVVEFHRDSLCWKPVPPKERMRHRKKRHDAPSTPRRENSAWRFGRIGRK